MAIVDLNRFADAVVAGKLKAESCLEQETQCSSKLEIETGIEVQQEL